MTFRHIGSGDGVSIHAPVKGATYRRNNCGSVLTVSIHAPVKGATETARVSYIGSSGFNPRAREGRDTPIELHIDDTTPSFNPRAREGRDGCLTALYY